MECNYFQPTYYAFFMPIRLISSIIAFGYFRGEQRLWYSCNRFFRLLPTEGENTVKKKKTAFEKRGSSNQLKKWGVLWRKLRTKTFSIACEAKISPAGSALLQ